MSKHTPGPWYVTELPEHRKERLRVTDMHDNDLARLCALDVGEDAARANAALMAAAPDLLTATTAALSVLLTYPASASRDNAIAMIDAAIARATGRQS